MSSTADHHDDPHTPQRRTSSSFLAGLFNRATASSSSSSATQRPVIPPQASPAPAPTLTPAQGTFARRPSLANITRAHSRSISENTVPSQPLLPPPLLTPAVAQASSAATTPMPGGARGTPSLVASGILGGGGNRSSVQDGVRPDISSLLRRLHKTSPLDERVSAALELANVVALYQLPDVRGIWLHARDLLAQTGSPEAIAAGYKLLAKCAAFPDLSPLERRQILQEIHAKQTTADLILRIDILFTLTDSGKQVDGLDDVIIPLLSSLLDLSFDNVREVRRTSRKKEPDLVTAAEEQPRRVVALMTNIAKFNMRILSAHDITMLLEQAYVAWTKGTRPDDMDWATALVDALFTHTPVPDECLRRTLEGLANVARQVEQKRALTLATVTKIFRSHFAQPAIKALLDVLLGLPAGRADRRTNIVRGAFFVLVHVWQQKGKDDGLPEIALARFLPAIREALQIESSKLANDTLKFLASVLESKEALVLLPEETDWAHFVAIVELCARKFLVLEDRKLLAENNHHHHHHHASGASGAGGGRPLSTVQDEDEDAVRNSMGELLHRILLSVNGYLSEADYIVQSTVMQQLITMGRVLPDEVALSVLRYYSENRMLAPSHPEWVDNCHLLVQQFFQNTQKAPHVRATVVGVLKNEYGTVEALRGHIDAGNYANLLLEQILHEDNPVVLNALMEFALYALRSAPDVLFDRFLELCRATMLERKAAAAHHLDSVGGPSFRDWLLANGGEPELGSPSNVLARACVRLFIRSLNTSAYRAQALYEFLLSVAAEDSLETDARITVFKLLSRLRSDSNHAIFLISGTESHSIAAVMCRTADTAVDPAVDGFGNSHPHTSKSEERTSSTTNRDTRISNPSGSPHFGAQRVRSMRPAKVLRPMWLYPGTAGLPEEPPASASHLLYSVLPDDVDAEAGLVRELNLGRFLELVIRLLQKSTDWEVYSYIIVHLASQLSNKPLFAGASQQVQFFRNVLCEQLRNQSFHEPPPHNSVKKGDVAVCLLHILTIITSYHALFKKSEEDDIVKTFFFHVGQHERTSKWCIHALTLCCLELPLSVRAQLPAILQKMSTIITQPALAIHILEFLACLSRIKDMYQSFTDNDFKVIFMMCILFLQSAREKRDRDNSSTALSNLNGNHSHNPLRRTSNPALRQSVSVRESTYLEHERTSAAAAAAGAYRDLPQYVYSLAYHVITFWFLSVRRRDRIKYWDLIIRGLTYADPVHGENYREEQAVVTIDFMQRSLYSDRDETVPDPSIWSSEIDGERLAKTWVVGTSLLTVETAGKTGLSMLTRRRPSGTRYTVYRPGLAPPPPHQESFLDGISGSAYYASDYVGITPEDIIQEMYSSFYTAPPSATTPEIPFPLPDDDATRRALMSFDRNSSVDGHKIGIIYIGDGQTTEKEILANVQGSQDYTAFVDGIGTLTKIKGADFNLQGLDREFGSDGEWTYCWRDRVTEIVFHVTTMMPTNLEQDPLCTRKKSHIGNDFVNIVFNNSGVPFQFDTFPSQFNYVYIVITPESRASFVDNRQSKVPEQVPEQQEQPNPISNSINGTLSGALGNQFNSRAHDFMNERFYKVQVIPQPGFPDISPAAEPKVVSGEHLPVFVRLVALNASFFSHVWVNRSEGGDHISSWRNRLREINRLRERHAPKPGVPVPNTSIGAATTTTAASSGPASPIAVASTSASGILLGGSTHAQQPVHTPSSTPTPLSILSHTHTYPSAPTSASASGYLPPPPLHSAASGTNPHHQQSMRDSGVLFNRASAATFMSDATGWSSGYGSVEMERQDSDGSKM